MVYSGISGQMIILFPMRCCILFSLVIKYACATMFWVGDLTVIVLNDKAVAVIFLLLRRMTDRKQFQILVGIFFP
jgi:hypothetical protein